MKRSAPQAWHVGAILLSMLALPPIRHLLTDSMTLQMLVQLPLLALAGALLARALPGKFASSLSGWNRGGASGLLLASLVGMLWMLPRAMDATVDDPWIALARFVSVPALIGVPLALSWPCMGFVARGVFLAEVIATTFRLAWLYLASPQRLCSNFLLGDQQQLGRLLLATGCAVSLWIAWQLLWGRVAIERGERQ